ETFADEAEIDDVKHEQLLNAVFALNGRKRNTNVIRGLSSTCSSVDLFVHARGTSKIQLRDLNLKQSKRQSQLKKPRSGFETEKAQRQVARDTLASEMSKWDPVVHEIRAATQTVFSKRPHGIKMYEAVQSQPFTPRTALEKEIYEALGKSEDIIHPNQELTTAEQRALNVMSVKEAKQRRAELLRHHELLSRVELKAKWQNKIKSKRYRKTVRKEKVMAEKKLLEELQKENPEAFLERLGQIEKERVEERFTLKHKGGGKFSRMHKAYSKFDDKTREAFQEMLQKSRELTKKQQEVSSCEDDNGDTNTNEADKNENTVASNDAGENDDAKKTEYRVSQLEFLKAVNRKACGWLDVNRTFVHSQLVSETNKEGPRKNRNSESKEKAVVEVTLQPVEDKILDDKDVDENDSDVKMKVTMEELFNDEDLVEQFLTEKADAEDKNLPKHDTKLPGWGNWAGPDYSKSKERKKQKTITSHRQRTQQDNVWLNPNRDMSIRKLQPKTLPFPYTSLQQYEASVRQPISRGFVRETAHKLLTKPEIVLKLGHIVGPLEKDDYFKSA
ncbi:unnamed protein product, partial [Candidula unifasciata]